MVSPGPTSKSGWNHRRRLNKYLRVRDQTQKPGRNEKGTASFTILQCDIQPGQSRAVMWMVQPRCGYQDVDIGCH